MWVSGCSARVCSKPRVSLIVKHGSCRDGASSSCGYGGNIALCLVSPPQVHGSAPGDGFLQSQVQLRMATRGVRRRPDLNRDPGSAVPEATTRMSSVPQQPPNRHLLSTYREYFCCVSCPSFVCHYDCKHPDAHLHVVSPYLKVSGFVCFFK